MMDMRAIQGLASRYQTTADNILREYLQHLFLSHLYRQKDADRLLFKGGTALRVIWQSPRFSEDLDFTGVGTSVKAIKATIERTLAGVEQEGVQVNIDEAKKTSGGYLAILSFQGEGGGGGIQLEISLRQGSKPRGITALIPSDFVPSFTLIHLDEKTLIHEKMKAVLSRGKARDYYDLYFILRKRLAFKDVFQADRSLRAKLLKKVGDEQMDLRRELKRFLPSSQHGLLKSFKAVLTSEIERNLPAL